MRRRGKDRELSGESEKLGDKMSTMLETKCGETKGRLKEDREERDSLGLLQTIVVRLTLLRQMFHRSPSGGRNAWVTEARRERRVSKDVELSW